MRCVENRKKHCWVCSEDYWPKQCPKADKPCYIIDQCCREIFNASYSFDEYYPLLMIAREAMLEA
jgi:hypothetical protein